MGFKEFFFELFKQIFVASCELGCSSQLLWWVGVFLSGGGEGLLTPPLTSGLFPATRGSSAHPIENA